MVIRCLAAAALFAVAGCAGVSHQPLPEAQDDTAEGFRYYQTAPYLLVHSDGKNGLVWRVEWLPDQTRKMVARPENFLAKVDTTLTFTDGVLTGAKDSGDATAAPKALLDVVAKAAPLAMAVFAADTAVQPAGEYAVPAPRLYRIVMIDAERVQFVGGTTDPEVVYVTLTPEVKK